MMGRTIVTMIKPNAFRVLFRLSDQSVFFLLRRPSLVALIRLDWKKRSL